jgi:hypothetical protein
MSGRQYTWARPGDNPTYEKLDRVLVSTKWKHNYHYRPLSLGIEISQTTLTIIDC